MNQSYSIFVIKVRMGISVRFVTVGCPSCVTDANVVVVLSLAFVLQSLDAVSSKPVAGSEFVKFELSGIAVDGNYSARIISS